MQWCVSASTNLPLVCPTAAVLEPVLDAVSKLGVVLQRRAGATILKVVCYAWLEHIKVQKIKFSLWGAQQLLKGGYGGGRRHPPCTAPWGKVLSSQSLHVNTSCPLASSRKRTS